MPFDKFFKPIRNPSLLNLFVFIVPVLAGALLLFINPTNLTGDFVTIAWNPGQELLTKGSVDANYPYPLWTLVALMPFVILPFKVATFLWFICNLLMLAASFAIFLKIFDLEVSRFALFLIIILVGYFPPVLYCLLYGQLTIFSLLILILTTLFFLRGQWTWLGIVLGLSFMKPQVMILLVGILLLVSLWHRRWQTLLGFGATILIMTLVSLPFTSSLAQIVGGGISSHLETYIRLSCTLWGLFLSLGISWLVPFLISLGLLVWVGWAWLPLFGSAEISSDRVLFLVSAAVIINLAVIPYSWLYNFTLLLFPLGYSFSLALKVKNKMRSVFLATLFLIMHPLILFLLVINNDQHSYQIISALALFVIMLMLEFQMPLLKET